LCEERDSTGGTVTRRFLPQGEQIGGTNYFFNRDHLGSIREMTDGTGAIRARYNYDPWGRRTKITGDLDADFGYTGHYYHAPSQLNLALYRAYNAELGRWLNRDPIGFAGSINLYTYVENSPVNLMDLLGLCDDDPIDPDYARENKAAADWAKDATWKLLKILLKMPKTALGMSDKLWDPISKFGTDILKDVGIDLIKKYPPIGKSWDDSYKKYVDDPLKHIIMDPPDPPPKK